MRTPLLSALLGLSMVGCLVGDAVTPEGGGSGSDGSGSNGSGSNSDSTRVDVTVDKTTVSTELKTANPITVTVTASGGFAGDVALAGTVVDDAGTAIPGWTVAFDKASVTVAKDGTATALATVNVPSESALAGTLKVTATSSAKLGTTAATSAFTLANQITFNVKVDNATGKCVYTADSGTVAAPIKVSKTTKVRFFNTGTANLVIHSGGPISHQGNAPNGTADPTTEPNTAYEQLATTTGAATWYCHAPATDLGANDPRILFE